jgi:cell division protein FtsB
MASHRFNFTRDITRFFARSGEQRTGARGAASSHSSQASRSSVAAPVRSFPNDDIWHHRKFIDNSRLVRQADPQAGKAAWKMIGSVGMAALLLICVLLPGAYNLLAGYQLQTLKAENYQLRSEQAALEVQASQLTSPARIQGLAREQNFSEPDAQSIVYLESKDGSSVAMDRKSDRNR